MKRKEQLKKAKLERKMTREMEEEIKFENLIKIFIALTVFILIFYFISSVFRGEVQLFNKKDLSPDIQLETQYDEILVGEVFNKEDEEYYVLFLQYTDTMTTTMLATIDSYKQKEDNLPVYVVDMDKGFNKPYLTDKDVRVKYNDLENLKVAIPTIMKIKDKEIELLEQGYDSITKELAIHGDKTIAFFISII